MTPSVLSRPARRSPGDPGLRARDEKLESLKAVVGKLAHDFNNFLVPQFGYVTLLKDELAGNPLGAQYAGSMEAAGRKSESYIESILLGMRPHRQFVPASFSFDQMLNAALDEWSVEIGAGITLRRAVQPCTFFGDERHWKNAIGHLLTNARFALALGGTLEVELSRCTLSGAEVERLGLEGDEVFCATFRDTGFGMSPAIAERAFEPFFTTRTQIKAAGLGLTIVHSVTQFHGGQVELHTGEDAGTTVTLWIPVGGIAGRERMASVGGPLQKKFVPRKKVLLMEEDPLSREVLRDWLGRLDLEVQAAKDFEDALRLFDRKPSEWTFVVAETDFAQGRGEDIYARLHSANKTVPWIFVAGRRNPQFDPGAPAPPVLRKPFTRSAFTEVIRKHTSV